jgi:hypothetical protein
MERRRDGAGDVETKERERDEKEVLRYVYSCLPVLICLSVRFHLCPVLVRSVNLLPLFSPFLSSPMLNRPIGQTAPSNEEDQCVG